MKYRSIIILVCVIVLLLLVAVLTGKKPEPKNLVSIAEIKRIIIERPADTTEIDIAQGKFRLIKPIEYPGDSTAIAELLNSLQNLKLGDVISSREEKFNDFEVGEKAIKLILKGKRNIAFYLGRYAGDYMHSYLRFVNDKKVYLAKGISKFLLDKKPDDWRDKTILKIGKNLIEKIVIDGEEIIRQDTLWFYRDKLIEKYRIENVLNNLSNLRASAFLDTSAFLVEKHIKIYAGGSEYIFDIGTKRDYNYPVRLSGNPTGFMVNDYVINSLTELIPQEEKKEKPKKAK